MYQYLDSSHTPSRMVSIIIVLNIIGNKIYQFLTVFLKYFSTMNFFKHFICNLNYSMLKQDARYARDIFRLQLANYRRLIKKLLRLGKTRLLRK